MRLQKLGRIKDKPRRPTRCITCKVIFVDNPSNLKNPENPGKLELCESCRAEILARKALMRASPASCPTAHHKAVTTSKNALNGQRHRSVREATKTRTGYTPQYHKLVDKRGRQL